MKHKLLLTVLMSVIILDISFPSGLDAQQRQQTTVLQAMETLKEKKGISFVYETSDIDTSRKVKVDFETEDINVPISQILEGQEVTFQIRGERVIVKKNIALTSTDKDISVNGLITDNNGEIIIGAQIVLNDNNTIGTISDIDGKWLLSVPVDAVLTVSCLGFEEKEVKVNGRRRIDIVLNESYNPLDEVVVIGYGTVKKKDLTGAVSSVKTDELPKSVNPSIGHMLAGRAAGLQVTQNSAQPGGSLTFNIRGYGSTNGNAPLIIVDGFALSGSGVDSQASDLYNSGSRETNLNSINPDDIESIEVLKDASATAIYGARAGHGVILITTKSGKEGKASVSYSNSFSIQNIINEPQMLTGRQFMEVANDVLYEKWMVENGVAPFGPRLESEIPSKFIPRYSRQQIESIGKGTDWMDLIMRNGFTHQHNVTLSGGTSKVKYLLSANYYDQKGLVKENDMKRLTARLNLDFDITKWLSFGTRLNISMIDNNNAALGTGTNEASGVLRAAQQFNPTLPVFDANGEYSTDPLILTHPNPVSILELDNTSQTERLLDNTYLEIIPLKGLKIRGTVGFDRQNGYGQYYANRNTYDGKLNTGKAARDLSKHFSWQYEVTATYAREIKEHSFSIMAGTSYQKFTYDGFRALNTMFSTDAYSYNNLGAGEGTPTVGSWKTSKEMASYFGRINYSYKGRYLLTATIRCDGSSDFAKNHKWGYFPSIAFAWRLSDEPFMKNVTWLSDAKLRISYGQTGNDGIGNRAMSTYGLEQSGINYYWMFNDRFQNGIGPLQMGNDNLKWETTTEANIGIDFGILDNRISLAMEMFQRKTSDLLATGVLPYYYIINTYADNIGATKSRGFEVTLNAHIFSRRNFAWTTNLVFSIYEDRWDKRPNNWIPASYEVYNANLNARYGYLNGGIIQSIDDIPAHMPNAKPGMLMLQDINSYKYDDYGNQMFDETTGQPLLSGKPDGKLDDADKVLLYENTPWQLGFTNSFSFYGFDLNIYCVGMFDRKGYNPIHTGLLYNVARIENGQNTIIEALDRWTPDNPDGKWPSSQINPYPWMDSDYGIEDMSFFRIKNITIGYTIPFRKVVKNMRVFVDVQNVWTFTKYSGQDPETDVYGGSPYPNCRSFSAGLNITF